MSTKLYSGLRVQDEFIKGKDISGFFSIIDKVSQVIRAAHKESARDLVGNEMVDFILEPSNIEPLNDSDYVFHEVEKAWNEEQAKLGSQHALNDPLRFNIVFGVSSKGNLLAYYFCGNDRRYREALDSLGIFEDYHYQNQTEAPAEFTEEQWRERGEEWDSILNDEGTFGDLPGWSLEGTTRPFMEAYLSVDEININDYAPERRRYARAYLNELTKRVFELFPERRQNNPFRVIFDLQTIVREHSKMGGFDSMPALDPFPLGTLFTVDKLPNPVKIDESLMTVLLERYAIESAR